MKRQQTLIFIMFLVVFLAGSLLVWRQKNDKPVTMFQQTLKVFEQDNDKQTVFSNPLAIENLRKRTEFPTFPMD